MTSETPTVLRYSAFTESPDGGNRAGVVLDAHGLDEREMQEIASAVGYSETAFLVAHHGDGDTREFDVRYFSPAAEVPFCGHATIAAAVAVAERDAPGALLFHTQSGPFPVVTAFVDGRVRATLTSVAPTVDDVAPDVLAAALDALGWSVDDLDLSLPPRVAYAGAKHLVMGVASRDVLAALDYNFGALTTLCAEHEFITLDLVWRESDSVYHARNPFPYGGVVEDPATGAAAAAFGGYLRALGRIGDDAAFTVLQGEDMGSPSRIDVRVHTGRVEVDVTGSAVAIAVPSTTPA